MIVISSNDRLPTLRRLNGRLSRRLKGRGAIPRAARGHSAAQTSVIKRERHCQRLVPLTGCIRVELTTPDTATWAPSRSSYDTRQ